MTWPVALTGSWERQGLLRTRLRTIESRTLFAGHDPNDAARRSQRPAGEDGDGAQARGVRAQAARPGVRL